MYAGVARMFLQCSTAIWIKIAWNNFYALCNAFFLDSILELLLRQHAYKTIWTLCLLETKSRNSVLHLCYTFRWKKHSNSLTPIRKYLYRFCKQDGSKMFHMVTFFPHNRAWKDPNLFRIIFSLMRNKHSQLKVTFVLQCSILPQTDEWKTSIFITRSGWTKLMFFRLI